MSGLKFAKITQEEWEMVTLAYWKFKYGTETLEEGRKAVMEEENARLRAELATAKEVLADYQKDMNVVSFYSRINHDRPRDYGEIVNPTIEKHKDAVARLLGEE